MRKVAILTDSNSGITQAESKELGIFVEPMPFYIDGELYYEDIDLTQEEFYEKLTQGGEITTSMPITGNLMDSCVALVYASDLTLQAAETNRESLDLEAIRQEINLHLPKYCQLAQLEQRNEEFEKTPKKSIRRFLYH